MAESPTPPMLAAAAYALCTDAMHRSGMLARCRRIRQLLAHGAPSATVAVAAYAEPDPAVQGIIDRWPATTPTLVLVGPPGVGKSVAAARWAMQHGASWAATRALADWSAPDWRLIGRERYRTHAVLDEAIALPQGERIGAAICERHDEGLRSVLTANTDADLEGIDPAGRLRDRAAVARLGGSRGSKRAQPVRRDERVECMARMSAELATLSAVDALRHLRSIDEPEAVSAMRDLGVSVADAAARAAQTHASFRRAAERAPWLRAMAGGGQ